MAGDRGKEGLVGNKLEMQEKLFTILRSSYGARNYPYKYDLNLTNDQVGEDWRLTKKPVAMQVCL